MQGFKKIHRRKATNGTGVILKILNKDKNEVVKIMKPPENLDLTVNKISGRFNSETKN